MLATRHNQSGVTLIEMAVGLVIFGIMTAMAVPSYSTWIQNVRIRSAAESIQTALQLARLEAVKRNGNVEFVMTNDDPIPANVDTLVTVAGGANWVIRAVDTTVIPNTYVFIEGKSGAEGGGSAGGATSVIAATDDTITFTSLGRTSLGANAGFQVTNPIGGNCVANGGPMRCLNVNVSMGGRVRTCDPSVVTAGDTRAC